MKTLYTTDLHYDKLWFKWIEAQQSRVDVICIIGNFLDKSKENDMITQIEWISNCMQNFQKLLFVCSGNHDILVDGYENWLDKIPDIVLYHIPTSIPTTSLGISINKHLFYLTAKKIGEVVQEKIESMECCKEESDENATSNPKIPKEQPSQTKKEEESKNTPIKNGIDYVKENNYVYTRE